MSVGVDDGAAASLWDIDEFGQQVVLVNDDVGVGDCFGVDAAVVAIDANH